ncbi:MAG: tRNA1(Val) (adenine(37)-N6)-methyltransferase [Paracoccaceae bacterium]
MVVTAEVVENRLIGGRVRILQPAEGYRAATDPVLLAAACLAEPGDAVLDLGCGVGAASLCLGARVSGLDPTGVELQPAYADLARQNAALNKQSFLVFQSDIRNMPDPVKQQTFDHVIMNPPWHSPAAIASPDAGRDLANRLHIDLRVWMAAAMSRVRPRGWLTLIQRAEWLPEILTELAPRAGHIAVLPLAARAGRPAKRVIVKARKGTNGPFRLAPPLVLHEGEAHPGDREHYSQAAKSILRDNAPLEF